MHEVIDAESAELRAKGEPLTVSVKEAAHLLGVSRRHVYTLLERGDLPRVRLGARVLVPRSAIRQLIEGAA